MNNSNMIISNRYSSGSGVYMDKPYTLGSSKYISLFSYNSFYNDMCSNFEDLISTIYYFPNYNGYNTESNTSMKVLKCLELRSYLTRIESNGEIYYVGIGLLLDEQYNILFCLSIKVDSIFDNYKVDLLGNLEIIYSQKFSNNYGEDQIDYGSFIMYVSTELHTDPKHATFYRRLKKIYLDDCFTKGIEMRITSSSKIKENTFANDLKISFSSLTQLDKHLTEDVPHLLMQTQGHFLENEWPLMLEVPPTPTIEEPVINPIVDVPRDAVDAYISGEEYFLSQIDSSNSHDDRVLATGLALLHLERRSENVQNQIENYSLVHPPEITPQQLDELETAALREIAENLSAVPPTVVETPAIPSESYISIEQAIFDFESLEREDEQGVIRIESGDFSPYENLD